jgi:hypothetical protein
MVFENQGSIAIPHCPPQNPSITYPALLLEGSCPSAMVNAMARYDPQSPAWQYQSFHPPHIFYLIFSIAWIKGVKTSVS